jgi:hypothetical protein
MKRLLIVIAILLLLPTNVCGLTLGKYFEAKRVKSTKLVMHNAYIAGLWYAYSHSNFITEKEGGQGLFCVPDDLPLDNQHIIDLIETYNYKSSLEAARNLDVGDILLSALVSTFPCPD